MTPAPPTVLVVAGTDPLAGAGVVADAMTLRAQLVWPLLVESAIVEQDSHGVSGFWPVDLELLQRQIRRAAVDATPRVWKTGVLASPQAVACVLRLHHELCSGPLVMDPVLRGGTTDGAPLAAGEMVAALRAALRPGVLVTPNAHELAALLDTTPARDVDALAAQTAALQKRSGAIVLGKGGHLEDGVGTDVLAMDGDLQVLAPHHWAHRDVHGTGCRLASAIAAGLAHGNDVITAVQRAREWMAGLPVVRIGKGRPQFLI
jgi:hydroxymethylpyrimidine/phosphomethylpyrimidine kinase